MSRNPETMLFFCDGSTRNNGKRNCVASAAACHLEHPILGIPQDHVALPVTKHPSNQRAELVALQLALGMVLCYLSDGRLQSGDTVYVVSDSLYGIKCLTTWLPTWKANGWQTTAKTAVKHADLIRQMDTVLDNIRQAGITVHLHHVRSHQPAPTSIAFNDHRIDNKYLLWRGNQLADTLAKKYLPSS